VHSSTGGIAENITGRKTNLGSRDRWERATAILHANGNCVGYHLRRLHNLAADLGPIAWPALPKRAWPKIRRKSKRASAAKEHTAIIAARGMPPVSPPRMSTCRSCSRLPAQEAGAIQRTGTPNHGEKLLVLLKSPPPPAIYSQNIKQSSANHRSAEFHRRCRVAGISWIGLYSYRHSWAQRAKSCGVAPEAIDRPNRAVDEVYAKGAVVICPALDACRGARGAKSYLTKSCRPLQKNAARNVLGNTARQYHTSLLRRRSCLRNPLAAWSAPGGCFLRRYAFGS
jgi:hypothetical protein